MPLSGHFSDIRKGLLLHKRSLLTLTCFLLLHYLSKEVYYSHISHFLLFTCPPLVDFSIKRLVFPCEALFCSLLAFPWPHSLYKKSYYNIGAIILLYSSMDYSRKYPPPPPPHTHTHTWTTLNWVPKKFRISKNHKCSFFKIPKTADSNLEEFQNFARHWVVFLEFQLKFTKFWKNSWISSRIRWAFYTGLPMSSIRGRVDIFCNRPILPLFSSLLCIEKTSFLV